MRDLVTLDRHDPALAGQAARSLVEQVRLQPARHQAPALHRAHRKGGNGQRVELGQRKGEVEEPLERLERLGRDLERQARLLEVLGRRVVRERDRPAGERALVLATLGDEWPVGERDCGISSCRA